MKRSIGYTALAALLAFVLAYRPIQAAPSIPLPAAACAALRADRAKLPTPMTPAQRGAMLNHAAWEARAAGVGLSRKVSGTFCPAPAGITTTISCDALFKENPASPAAGPWSYWDVIVGDAAQSINCGPSTNQNGDPARRWLAPVDPGGGSTPIPPVVPPVPPDLTGRVVALETIVASQQKALTVLDARLTVLGNRVTALEAAPAPCVPHEVSTTRDGGGWYGPGHSHRVTVC